MTATITSDTTTGTTPKGISSGQKQHIIGLIIDAFNLDEVLDRLSNDGAQRIVTKGGEFKESAAELADGDIKSEIEQLIADFSEENRYADEEVESSYSYPAGYALKPIGEQVDILAGMFGLSLGLTSEFLTNVLPTLTLPDGEGWFAIPSIDALAKRFFADVTDPAERYSRAVQLILSKIGESRRFYNYRDGQLDPNYLRLTERTAHAMDIIAEQQQGDIVIVAGQFGAKHAGRSVRRAREVFTPIEFGFGSFHVGSMLLTHPERLTSYDDLWPDCPGDDYSFDAAGTFGDAPYFYFADGRVRFLTTNVSSYSGRSGSPSGFLPQLQ